MSELKVNKISPRSGTAITLGDSGDTFTIPSGATLAIAGSVTGFTSAGIDDNATSVAITIDSSERVGIGSTAPGTDAGANADSLVIKKTSGNVGMSIITDGSSNANIFLGDTSDSLNALVQFNDSANELRVGTSNGGGDLVLKSGAGVEALRIDDTGRVGIGTSSPNLNSFNNAVTLSGTNNAGYELAKGSTLHGAFAVQGDDRVQLINFQNADLTFNTGTSATERMRIDHSTGNIGIGTTAPINKLHIFNTDFQQLCLEGQRPTMFLKETNGNANENFQFRVDGGNLQLQSQDDAQSSATTRLLITQSGNVGIGTSSPSQALTILGNPSRIMLATASSGNGTLTFDASEYALISNSSTAPMTFATNSTERMRILNNGNVGIGTSNPNRDLVIKQSSGDASFRMETASNNNDVLTLRNGSGRLDIGNLNIVISSSGNVGIGTVNPAHKIELHGDGGNTIFAIRDTDASPTFSNRYIKFQDANGTEIGKIIRQGSAVSYSTSSDYRLKENIVEMTDATERLKQLQPKRFNFIGYDNVFDGFIAHEVSSIVPEAISGEKDAVDENGNPEYQGIDQAKLVPLLVKTIQELEARITTLEANNP